MRADAFGVTVSALLTELGPSARFLTDDHVTDELRLLGACLISHEGLPLTPEIVLVVPDPTPGEVIASLRRLPADPRRVVVLTGVSGAEDTDVRAAAQEHVVIAADVDPATVILAVSGVQHLPNDAATRRLTSLQRTLTQVLGDQEPVVALLNRVKGICNATAALVDKHGRAVHATGPLPLSMLFAAISQTTAETQLFDVDGWTGVADRIHDVAHEGGYTGWLLVTARRDGFPGTYEASAAHVAAALVEASQRMTAVTREQERAVRAAVLEEALAQVPMPAHPELAGRIASLGLTWSEEIRAVVLQPVRSSSSARGRKAAKEVSEVMVRALGDAAVPHLVSVRDRSVTILVQGSASTVRRAVVSAGKGLPDVHVGVGRQISSVGDVPTSFHDAQLAVQTLRRSGRPSGLMSYEDFDFATRLFSDVGTGRMTQWARSFLEPLEEREPLLEGLRLFFQHGQNMNAAADALSIHHNSLRYRLAKAEELLEVNLRDPGAVASVFLALAALELEETNAPEPRVKLGRADVPADIAAPRSVRDGEAPSFDNLGVVYGPDRQ
jgi:sugar diacid utilization regulator